MKKDLIKRFLKNKKINSILQRLFVNLHNQTYKLISLLVVLENNGLHPKHRIMKYHDFFVNNTPEGSTVLDIGCGNGALAFDVAEKASKIIAIELNGYNLKVARNKYSKKNIEYIKGDATKYDFDGEFDAVILSNVLEHLDGRVEFLKKIKNLADKFLIRVPMIDRDWLAMYKKEKGFEYRLDQEHKIEYTLDSFKKEIELAGLKLEDYSIQFGEIWAVVSGLINH